MSAKITTPFGHPMPPAPRHSVTVHMGPWENAEKYGVDSRSVIASFKNAYPRMKPHKDIASLAAAVLTHLGIGWWGMHFVFFATVCQRMRREPLISSSSEILQHHVNIMSLPRSTYATLRAEMEASTNNATLIPTAGVSLNQPSHHLDSVLPRSILSKRSALQWPIQHQLTNQRLSIEG